MRNVKSLIFCLDYLPLSPNLTKYSLAQHLINQATICSLAWTSSLLFITSVKFQSMLPKEPLNVSILFCNLRNLQRTLYFTGTISKSIRTFIFRTVCKCSYDYFDIWTRPNLLSPVLFCPTCLSGVGSKQWKIMFFVYRCSSASLLCSAEESYRFHSSSLIACSY